MDQRYYSDSVLSIFKQLNAIPRPSHHEEKVADFLCGFARERKLEFERDANDCVVIRKKASKGYEKAPAIVLLNHMDMVAVSDGSRPFDPLTDGIDTYEENGWLKARGTSLGADNGIGLSMALAVLDDESILHGPIEVLTTTNEEDGMSGAANISPSFIKGRLVINLDSEDYDTITIGAAGAYLQTATFNILKENLPGLSYFKIILSGGLGGHSGVDINKRRTNANKEICDFLASEPSAALCSLRGGSANASIAAECCAVVGVDSIDAADFKLRCKKHFEALLDRQKEYEPDLSYEMLPTNPESVIKNGRDIISSVADVPFGVIRMHESLPGTVMTSNNIGIIATNEAQVTVSCHTRSFSDTEMIETAESISNTFRSYGANVQIMMNTPGWQENAESKFLRYVEDTFVDVLDFSPKRVAMHFVLEAGYYVRKFPGIQIACIGPRIVEPHSPSERVEISTINNIWMVLVKLLAESNKLMD